MHGGIEPHRFRGVAPAEPLEFDLEFRHVAAAVCALHVGEVHHRRIAHVDRHIQPGGAQEIGDGIEPLRTLGMAVPHVVQTAVWVAIKSGRHLVS